MPCYDPYPEILSRKTLDERTDMLCRTLVAFEECDPFFYSQLPKDILEWHECHKEHDKKNA